MRLYRQVAFALAGLILLSASIYANNAKGELSPAESADLILHPILIDTAKATFTASDSSWPDMVGNSLRHGLDTTVSACEDFYQFVNGGWRNETTFNQDDRKAIKISFFGDVAKKSKSKFDAIIDSAHKVVKTTENDNLRVVGELYESCLTADSLNLRSSLTLDSSRAKPYLKKGRPTRQEACNIAIKSIFGEAIGQVYVDEVFDEERLKKIEVLLEAIRDAAIERLDNNPWMTAEDIETSKRRLNRLLLRVGLPPQKIDYSGLSLGANYQDNYRLIQGYYMDKAYRSVGIDNKDKWRLSLINPNAFYMGADHAIEVPPIMFSPPFFDYSYDDALNFGAIGHIIGHEMFHSVEFGIHILDGSDRERQVKLLKDLHTSLGSLDGWDAYGNRTFREDAADLGGVNVAYAAWKQATKKSGKIPEPLIDGFTPDQRFFLAVARVWRSKWDLIPRKGAGDVHGPPFARVNGTLMNMPEFAEAFGCKPGDNMVLPEEKRSRIW